MRLVLIVSIKRCGEVTSMKLRHQVAVASGRQQTSVTHWEDLTFPGHKGGRGPVDDPEHLACLQETSLEGSSYPRFYKARQHTHGGEDALRANGFDPGRAQAHGWCRRSWNSLPGSHLRTPFSVEQPLWTTKVTDLRAVVKVPSSGPVPRPGEAFPATNTSIYREAEPDSRIYALLLFAWCLE